MAKAFWNETLIAESDDIALVEGNAYFPIESVNFKYFGASDLLSLERHSQLLRYHCRREDQRKRSLAVF